MNIKRIIALALAACTLASVLSFTGCDMIKGLLGGEGEGDPAGSSSLTMEAEYINIDDVKGAGISNNNSGLSMIYGNGTDAEKEMWSGGYYVGFTHNSQCVLEFVFNASKATTANIVIYIGFELVDTTMDPESIAIAVNDVDQFYSPIFVEQSPMDEATFVPLRFNAVSLKEGENKIAIKVLANDLGGKDVTRGPLVDYVKVTSTDAKLTWTPKTDNPERRDNEV